MEKIKNKSQEKIMYKSIYRQICNEIKDVIFDLYKKDDEKREKILNEWEKWDDSDIFDFASEESEEWKNSDDDKKNEIAGKVMRWIINNIEEKLFEQEEDEKQLKLEEELVEEENKKWVENVKKDIKKNYKPLGEQIREAHYGKKK